MLKKTLSVLGPAMVVAVAIYAGVLDAKPVSAESVTCSAASQTCYEVYIKGVKVRSPSGVAQIRL